MATSSGSLPAVHRGRRVAEALRCRPGVATDERSVLTAEAIFRQQITDLLQTISRSPRSGDGSGESPFVPVVSDLFTTPGGTRNSGATRPGVEVKPTAVPSSHGDRPPRSDDLSGIRRSSLVTAQGLPRNELRRRTPAAIRGSGDEPDDPERCRVVIGSLGNRETSVSEISPRPRGGT
jgi:hypothetical protein